MLQTVVSHKLTNGDEESYLVTVEYDKASGIPENAALEVTELTEGTAEYDDYVARAAEALRTDVDCLYFAYAFDITLVDPETGVKYQPSKDVRVSIELLKESVEKGDSVSVVHFPGTYTAKSIDDGEKPDGAEVLNARIDGKSVVFASDSFSVYVVVENQPSVSYIFVDPDGREYPSLRQTLKEGGTLVAPESPSDGGRVFDHWSEVINPADPATTTVFDGWGTVTVPELPEGRMYPVFRYLKAVYADDTPQVRVVYYDQQNRILRTDFLPSGTLVDPAEVAYTALQIRTGEYLVFQYWTENPYLLYDENGEVSNEGEPLRFAAQEVTQDVALYPYCSQFHWIYFDGNKRETDTDTTKPESVAYTAPLLVTPGVVPNPAPVPTLPVGYRFMGWFTRPDDDGEEVFDATGAVVADMFTAEKLYHGGDKLANDLTVYAHWETEELATFSVVAYVQRPGDAYSATGDGYHYDFKYTVVPSGTYMAKTGSTVGLTDINLLTVEQAAARADARAAALAAGQNPPNAAFDTANVTFTDANGADAVACAIDLVALLANEDGVTDASDLTGIKLDTDRSVPVTVAADGTTVFRIYLSRRVYHLIFKDYQWHGGNKSYNPLTDGITNEMLEASYNGKTFPTVKEYDALYGQDISQEFPVYDANGNPINSLGYYLNKAKPTQLVTGGKTAVLTGNSWLDADGSSLGNRDLFKRIDYLQALKHDTEYFVHNSINAQSHKLVYYLEMLDATGVTTTAPVNGEAQSPRYVTLNGKTFERLGQQLNYGGGGFSAALFYDIDGFTQYKAINGKTGKQITTESHWKTANDNNHDVYLYYTRDYYYVYLKYVLNGAAPNGSKKLKLLFETPVTETLLSGYYNDLGTVVSLRKDDDGNDIWWYNDTGCNDVYDFSHAKVPNHDITIYKGLKTSVPIEIDPDGGVLNGKNGSTWFNVDNGELISEYAVTREYVPVDEAGVDYAALTTAYKYVRYPYNTVINGKQVRTATYVELTESELNYLITNKNGRYMDGTEEYSDGVAYVYAPGVYKLQYWYSVTATFDSDEKKFVTNEQPSDAKKAFNFSIHAVNPVYLKAKWADASVYTVVYDAGEGVSAPTDPDSYNDGAQAKVLASAGHPDGKVFRFWATVKQKSGESASDFATLYPTAKRTNAYGNRVYPDARKYTPNASMDVNKYVTKDRGANRVVTLYAWYDDGSFSGEAATYDFFVQDADGTWHDASEDVPYYEEIISPGEELIVPDPPTDPKGQNRAFTGWYLDRDCKHRFEGFGVIAMPQNHKLYAGFSTIYTVTYYDKELDENGQPDADAITITEQVYLENEPLNTVGVSPVVTNEQYVDHWTTDGTDSFVFDGKGGPVTSNMALYPVLGTIYTVRFESQGGTYVAPITFPKDLNQWMPAPTEPERTGYKFMGWWSEARYAGVTAEGTRTDEGVCYAFDQPLKKWADDNSIPVPTVFYAHWERNGDPIETTIKVNYWVQNPDRKGYTLYNTEVYDADENGVKYTTGIEHALTDAEKSLDNMRGYYTFSEDQVETKPDSANDDAAKGYFVLSTPDNYTQGGADSIATDLSAKTILDDGATEYNVYFNRKTYTLVFEPDRKYLVTEYVGHALFKGLTEWEPATQAVASDNTVVTYDIDGGFKDTITTQANGDYKLENVWLGKDISSEVWPVQKDVQGVQNQKTWTDDPNKGKLTISYTSKNVGYSAELWKNLKRESVTFKDQTTNHSSWQDPGQVLGDVSLILRSIEKTAGYRWYTPWDGYTDGSNKWANAFSFASWAVCEGVVDGSSIVSNAGKRNASYSKNIDSIKYGSVKTKQNYIDRSILPKGDIADNTITLVAEYAQKNVYTTSAASTNPVEVRYFLINKDANNHDVNIPLSDDYTQIVYNVAGTGTGTNWKPTTDGMATIKAVRSQVPGYTYDEVAYADMVKYDPDHPTNKADYGTIQSGGTKYIPRYAYYLPVNTYYHKLLGGFFHALQLRGTTSGSRLSLVRLNGRWYWKVTAREGRDEVGVEAGAYNLAYRRLLLYFKHGDTDAAYTFPARRLHIARYANGVSTTEIKKYLETTYASASDIPPEGGRVFISYRKEKVNNNTNFVNLYFRPGRYTLTLKSSRDDSYIQTLTPEYTTFLTNADCTNGEIYDKIHDGTIAKPTVPAGYEFKCWSTSRNSDTPFEGTMPNYNLTLYAQFKPKDFTVITQGVDANGELLRENGEIVRDADGNPLSWAEDYEDVVFTDDDGNTFTIQDYIADTNDYEATRDAGTQLLEYELPTPNVQGYEVFYGWKRLNADGTLSSGYVTSTTVIMDDLILVPDIRVNKSGKVEYYKNDTELMATVGPFYLGATTKAIYGTVDGSANAAALQDATGRYFVCWKNPLNDDVFFPGDNIDMPATGETLKLYAVYSKLREVTLIYHLNGGSGFAPLVAGTTVTPETVNGETVIKLFFSNYDETNNHTLFPNVTWPASADGDKVAFVPVKSGETFLKWNDKPDGSGMDVLSTDTLRVDTLPLDRENTFHLYAQWRPIMLPVTVYEAWYGDTATAEVRNALSGKDPFLQETTSQTQTIEYTANTWYNAYDRNGLTYGVQDKTNYVLMAGFANNVERVAANRITDVRFNADASVNGWQYSTDNQAHWVNFGEAGLALYYFPEEIIPVVYYVIENSDGSLTEVQPSAYNIDIRTPDTINTRPSSASDTVGWVATTLDRVKDEASRGVIVDPGFHTIGVESDGYLLDYLAVGSGKALLARADQLYAAKYQNLYAQNTREGMRYADTFDGLQTATPTVGVSAIYAVYKQGRPICKVVHEGREYPFTSLKDALKFAEDEMGGTASIQMLTDYEMSESDRLIIKKTDNITLTTAATSGGKFNFTCAEEGRTTAIITRGGDCTGSLITINSAATGATLTLDNITLDGGSEATTPLTATTKGGLVQVSTDNATLNVNESATLRNSTLSATTTDGSGMGGAIWLHSGTTLNMAGTIDNCSAINGGGIYAEQGETTINITGAIQNCASTGNVDGGGAVYTSQDVTVNVQPDAVLSGNTASKRGGAILSQGHVVITGGTLTGNTSTDEGAAVYIASNATLAMSGGEITGNTSNKGAVGVGGKVEDNNLGTLTFSGDAKVYGNKRQDDGAEADVYLNKDSAGVIRSGDLSADAQIGVFVPDVNSLYDHRGGGNDPFGTITGSTENLSCFYNNRNGLCGGVGDNNEIIWMQPLKVIAIYADSVDFANPEDTANLKISSAETLLAETQLTAQAMTLDEIVAAVKDNAGFVQKTGTMCFWRIWRLSDQTIVEQDGDPAIDDNGDAIANQHGYEALINDLSVTGVVTGTEGAANGLLCYELKNGIKSVVSGGDALVVCYTEPVYLSIKNNTSVDGKDTASVWQQSVIGKSATVTDEDTGETSTVYYGLPLIDAAEVLDPSTNEYVALANDRASITPAKDGSVSLRIIGGGGLEYSLRGGFDNPALGISVAENNVWKADLTPSQARDYTLIGTLVTAPGGTTALTFTDVSPTTVPLVIQKLWDPATHVGNSSIEFTVYGHLNASDTTGTALTATDDAGHVVTTLSSTDHAMVNGADTTWAKVVYVPHASARGTYASYTVKENVQPLQSADPTACWADTETYQTSEWQPVNDGYVEAYVKLHRMTRQADPTYSDIEKLEFMFSDATEENFYSTVVDFGTNKKDWAALNQYYYVKVRMPASVNFSTVRLLCVERASNTPQVYSDATGRLNTGILYDSVYGVVIKSTRGQGLPSFRQKGSTNTYNNHAFVDIEFLHEDEYSGTNAWTGTETLYTFPHAQDNPRLVITNRAYICKVVDDNGNEHGFTSLNAALTFARGSGVTMDAEHPVAIQMVADYEMPASDALTLTTGDNIILKTAAISGDETYLYVGAGRTSDGAGQATISRGFAGDNMIITEGSSVLTLSDIKLDGKKDTLTPNDESRLVKVLGTSTLNITNGALLTNSNVYGWGGAVYAVGTVNMTGGTMSDNTAAHGAAVYVVSGDTVANSGTFTMTGGSITGNHVDADTGAVEVGGANARLYFSGNPIVYDNTYVDGGKTQQKNVVFCDADSGNNVINTTSAGLTGDVYEQVLDEATEEVISTTIVPGAHIGIYVAGDENSNPYKDHGGDGDKFGTYDSTAGGSGNANLYCFTNDRNGMYGDVSSNAKIQWTNYVCKITRCDAGHEGELLYYYRDKNNKGEAVFKTLNDAFAALEYLKEDAGLNTAYDPTTAARAVKIEMLVDGYELPSMITANDSAYVTLTTAKTDGLASNDTYKYRSSGTTATILRGENCNSTMFKLDNSSVFLTLNNITVDGDTRQNQTNQTHTTVAHYGALFRIAKGNLTLDDKATLQNGNSSYKGGGVYLGHATASKFYMKSGSLIQNCTAGDGSNYAGGGVCIHDGYMEMSGGTIQNCHATDTTGSDVAHGNLLHNGCGGAGGGIAVGHCDTLKITGGTITGCTAQKSGGAIEIHGDVYMSGGEITNCSGGRGGAVNFYDTDDDDFGGRLYLSGAPKIHDNYTNGVLKNIDIYRFDCECGQTINKINVNGPLSASANVGVYAPVDQDTEGKFFGRYTTSADNAFNIFTNDKYSTLVGSDGGTENGVNRLMWKRVLCKIVDKNGDEHLFATLKDAVSFIRDADNQSLLTAPKTATIQMLRDYEMPDDDTLTIQAGDNITLTTASKAGTSRYKYTGTGDTATITRGNGYASTPMVSQTGGTFMLSDSSVLTSGGKPTGITLDGGNKDTTTDGSIVKVTGGALNITDGATLENAKTSAKGGAVYVGSSAEANMTGGTITGNAATNGGAAVYVDATSTAGGHFNMSGGSITINTISDKAGAINVGGSKAELTFSGNPTVFDNADVSGNQKNVVLDQDSTGVIKAGSGSAGLGADAYIGVYVTDDDSNTEGKTIYDLHGRTGTDFASCIATPGNLEAFVNDRDPALYGTKNGTLVQWTRYVCKLTTENDVLLYTQKDHKHPAVYRTLKAGFEDTSKALYYMENGTWKTYGASEDIKLKMLVDYTLADRSGDGGLDERNITYANSRKVTFTTAENSAGTLIPRERYLFETTRTTDAARALIQRGDNGASLFTVNAGTFATTNIVLDGGASTYSCTGDGGIFYLSSGELDINSDTILRNSIAVNGGMIYVNSGTMTANGSAFYDFKATKNGGAIYNNSDDYGTYTNNEGKERRYSVKIGGNSVFDGHQGVLDNTEANAVDGGVVYNVKGDLRIEDSQILDFGASGNGGAIYDDNTGVGATDMDTVSLYDVTIDGHAGGLKDETANAVRGGAIYTKAHGAVDQGGSARLKDCEIRDCVASDEGGALYSASTRRDANTDEAKDEPTVHMLHTIINGHDSLPANIPNATRGGAILLANGTLEMESDALGDSVIRNCTASSHGGAIDSYGGGTQFRGLSQFGTAIDYTVKLKNIAIENCTAATNGGAIYIKKLLTMTDSHITGCSSGNQGGAIYMRKEDAEPYARLNMSGGYISGNSSTNGGAVEVQSDNVRLNFSGDARVYGNLASDGAQKNVVLAHDSNLIINTTSAGLTSGAHIGVYVTGGVDEEPYASHGGFADCFGTYQNAANLDRFTNDRNGLYGEVCTDHSDKYHIRWQNAVCVLTDNEGHYLYRNIGTAEDPVYVAALYTNLNDAFGAAETDVADANKPFKYNSATGTYEPYNGSDEPIQVQMLRDYVQDDTDLVDYKSDREITLTTASGTETPTNPYVFHPKENATGSSETKATITRKDGSSSTSPMFTFSTGNAVTVSDLIVDGNNTTSGGVFEINDKAADNVTIPSFDGVEVNNANNTTNGGAIILNGLGDATVKDSVFTNCSAGGKGGAIYSANTPDKITVTNCAFEDCHATTGGGAMSVQATELAISGKATGHENTFTGCYTTTGNGGAVDHRGGATETKASALTMTNVTVDGKDTEGNATTTGGNGGAVYTNASGSVTLTDCEFKNCVVSGDGGAVYQEASTAETTVTGGKITSCEADNGGAIYVAGTKTDIIGTEISGCNATDGNGGGVYAQNAVTISPKTDASGNVDTPATISDCEARGTGDNKGLGGAIYVANGTTTLNGGNGTTAKPNGVIITGNSGANANGGAINAGNGAKLKLEGDVKVADNTDASGDAKNVVLQYANTIETTGDGLGDNASVGVYVVDGDTNKTFYNAHGIYNTPFATFGDTGHANAGNFTNDRNGALTGTSIEGRSEVYWTPVVCKLTDESGVLLYKDENGHSPAVYTTLTDAIAATATTTQLYYADGTSYVNATTNTNDKPIRVEMLKDYAMDKDEAIAIGNTNTRDLTFTTAGKTPSDDDVYVFTPNSTTDANKATLSLSESRNAPMFTVTTDKTVTFDGLILDGNGSDGKTVTGDGGAIKVESGTVTLKSTTIEDFKVNGNGGGVYVSNGATLNMNDASHNSTVNGNSATGDGAGVYLAEGSTLNLAGSPNFGGTGTADATGETLTAVISGSNGTATSAATNGNYKTDADYPTGTTNGQQTYTTPRQDIFVAGYATENSTATSIVVTGALDVPKGSIWVYVDEAAHSKMLTQFATVASGVTMTDATYAAFRNAQDDATTECGGDYLTGQEGDSPNLIKWTGGFDFAFRKIKGDGAALNGATFTLYKANTDGTGILMENGKKVAYQMTVSGTKQDATATSANVAADAPATIKVNVSDKAEDRNIYGDGLVVFDKIPPGTYFIEETTAPTIPDDTSLTYKPATYKLVLDGKGWTTIYAPNKDANGNDVWTGTLQEAPTTTFVDDGTVSSGVRKYTVPTSTSGTDTLQVYNLMNVDPRERRIILRKIGTDDPTTLTNLESLANVRFKIYRADLTEVADAESGYLNGCYTTNASGVYFVGRLPVGTYYLRELEVPTGYAGAGAEKWFTLTVTATGVTCSTARDTMLP